MAFAESPIRRYASPRRSRCEVSFGSCRASCSRTSTGFSRFPFLSSSAAESLSLRVSTTSLAIPSRLSRAPRLRKNLSPPPPASWFGGAVAVAAGRERRRPGRAGLRLLACLVSQQLDLGAAQGTDVGWTHARDRDAAIIGAVQLDHWRADRLHQPLDEVGPPFRDDEAHPGIPGRAALHGGFESLGAAILEP